MPRWIAPVIHRESNATLTWNWRRDSFPLISPCFFPSVCIQILLSIWDRENSSFLLYITFIRIDFKILFLKIFLSWEIRNESTSNFARIFIINYIFNYFFKLKLYYFLLLCTCILNRFSSIETWNFFRIGLDRFGIVRKQILKWLEIVLIRSDHWIIETFI